MAAVKIRPAEIGDLAAIVGLYNHYILHTPVTFDLEPYGADQRRGWFAQFNARGRHRLLVAVEQGQLLGYCHSQPLKPKGAYKTSVETSVYLAPEQMGRGLGSMLYDALFECLEQTDVHRAYGLVVLPNDASMSLHVKHGFKAHPPFSEIGYKFGRFHDVQWFERPLPLG